MKVNKLKFMKLPQYSETQKKTIQLKSWKLHFIMRTRALYLLISFGKIRSNPYTRGGGGGFVGTEMRMAMQPVPRAFQVSGRYRRIGCDNRLWKKKLIRTQTFLR